MYVLLESAVSSAGRQQQIRVTNSSNKTHSYTLHLRQYVSSGKYVLREPADVLCLQVSWNSGSSTPEPDLSQRDRPATCVIAKHYSPATLLSLRFYCREEIRVYGALCTFNLFHNCPSADERL